MQKAEDGDPESLKILLKHLLPPPRLSPGIRLEGDLAEQIEQLRAVLADGTVGTHEAQLLIRLMLAQSTIQTHTREAGATGLTAEEFTLLRAELKADMIRDSRE